MREKNNLIYLPSNTRMDTTRSCMDARKDVCKDAINRVLTTTTTSRQSLRLKNYDYSSEGAYFVTICVKGMECVFGDVIDDQVVLNDIGRIVKKNWEEITKHFKNVELDEFIVMPNHIHGIIFIISPLCTDALLRMGVCKDACIDACKDRNRKDAINRVLTSTEKGGGITGKHNPMLSKNSLSNIIRWFKAKCTYQINRIQNKIYFQWLSRFHDRIIRDEKELLNIRNYIKYNPRKWELDKKN